METIIAALITGAVTGGLSLAGILASNGKAQAVMAEQIASLRHQVERHNSVIERTYALEQDMAVAKNDIVTLYKRTEDER